MPIAEVDEILKKYKQNEDKIDTILNNKNTEYIDSHEETEFINRRKLLPTPEEAKERNIRLLKDLETVKGNLRSKAIFSPTELQWEKICKQYRQNPSLPITTWKCHLPVYV